MMRACVSNLLLSRASNGVVQRPWRRPHRRLHSDAPHVAPAAVQPARVPEPRPPLADLLGRRHNYLRISLTERCNLRCQYCMPAEGVQLSPKDRLLTAGEVSRLVRVLASLGIEKIRLTGGEPTISKHLADIIRDIREVKGIQSVSMTTNGLVLTRKLVELQRAGLSAVNISLDSLRPDRYETMARRAALPRVLAGIDLALQLGLDSVKVNTVLMKGFNDDEICDFVEFTKDRELDVRFIEFMPFSGNAWDDSKLVPYREALRSVTERHPDVMACMPEKGESGTARMWQVPGYKGRIGFIASMTQNFCSTCNRLRITADGNLKVCLFGASEVSLRDAVRAGATDDDLEQLIRTALNNKKPQHAVTGRRRRAVTSSEHTLTANKHTDTSGKHKVTANKHTDTSGKHKVTANKHTDTSGNHKITAKKHMVTSSKHTVTAKKHMVTSSKHTVTLKKHCITSGKHTVTSENVAIPAAKHTLLSGKHTFLSKSLGKYTIASPLAVLLTPTVNKISMRAYSTDSDDNVLTHLDKHGKARMVDVGGKTVTSRVAEAQCYLRVGGRLLRLLRDASLPKGDALTVAQIAGVVGAKRTSDLIPLCHPLPLDCVRIRIELPKEECEAGGDIKVHCEVKVTSKTGAEMEALTGASVAALALYDMCKSVDKYMKITDLKVVRKSGGRSGSWPKESVPDDVKVRDYNTTPIKPDETYAPTNIMYL